MGFFEVIRRGGWQAFRHSLVWFVLVVFAGLLPILGSYVMISNLGGVSDFKQPLRHGELALLSISLLASAAFVIARGTKIVGIPSLGDDQEDSGLSVLFRLLRSLSFPGLLVLIPLIFVEAVFATLLFATAISADVLGVSDPGLLDARIIQTGILLAAGLATAFTVALVDESLGVSPVDARDLFQRDQGRWRDNVDKSWEEMDHHG